MIGGLLDGVPIPAFARPWIGWVVGMDWPQGDEKALFRLADTLVTALREVVGGPDGDPSRGLLGSPPPDQDEWDGEALKAFVRHVLTTTTGHQADAVNRLAAMALALNDLGVQVEYTKRMIKLTVALLVVQIGGVLLLRGTLLAGPALTWIGFRALFSRAMIAQLAKRLLLYCGLFGTIMGAMDYAVQASQSRRDNVDFGQVFMSAGTGALSGALLGLGTGLLPSKSMLVFMAQSGVVGGITALVSEVWAAASTGRPINWKLVAEGITSGFVGGIDRNGLGGGALPVPGRPDVHLVPADGTATPTKSPFDGAGKGLPGDFSTTPTSASGLLPDGIHTGTRHDMTGVGHHDVTSLARASADQMADQTAHQVADVARAVPDEVRTGGTRADDSTQAGAAAVPQRGVRGEVTHERAHRPDSEPDPGGRPGTRPERTGRPEAHPEWTGRAERAFAHHGSLDRSGSPRELAEAGGDRTRGTAPESATGGRPGDGGKAGDTVAPHADASTARTDAPAPRADDAAPRADDAGTRALAPGSRADTSAARTDDAGSRAEVPGPRVDAPASRAEGPASRAGEPPPTSLAGERTPEPGNRIEGLINWGTTRSEPPSRQGMTHDEFAALSAKGTVGEPVRLSNGTESVKVERVTLTDGGSAVVKETATTEMRDAEHLASVRGTRAGRPRRAGQLGRAPGAVRGAGTRQRDGVRGTSSGLRAGRDVLQSQVHRRIPRTGPGRREARRGQLRRHVADGAGHQCRDRISR
ncbi:hypothetical protein ACFXJ8_00930 [Nonomuraea sp. NPDC059194]|uniref:WXG100-like domain-containing protein n=1 Tax=Nonomuraea sp. NPDC059194 TaxID=3346764 RepID=UPI00369C47FA